MHSGNIRHNINWKMFGSVPATYNHNKTTWNRIKEIYGIVITYFKMLQICIKWKIMKYSEHRQAKPALSCGGGRDRARRLAFAPICGKCLVHDCICIFNLTYFDIVWYSCVTCWYALIYFLEVHVCKMFGSLPATYNHNKTLWNRTIFKCYKFASSEK